jgi:hypothetical protein
MDTVNETGFDPVDAGSLDESWRQQPGTPAYCCDYDVETTRKGLAAAVKDEAPKKRERLVQLYSQRGSNMTHADIVAMSRSLTRSTDCRYLRTVVPGFISSLVAQCLLILDGRSHALPTKL